MTKSRPAKEWQQFQFRVRRITEVVVTVEAKDARKARELAESGDWIDEREVANIDWEVVGSAAPMEE